ncbi:MAG: hypothetical protein LAO30_25685, partial [Acidobacteriia bacterium]|nr:hypothetical protein [Terriglobia bacterium]
MQITRTDNRRHAPSRAGYRLEYPSLPTPGYWDLLWTHRNVFVGSVVACVVIAAVFSFSTTPVYQARGSLELQTPPAAAYGARDNEGASPVTGQPFDAYLETQIGILQSDTLIRRVITRLNLGEQINGRKPYGLAALWTKHLPGAPPKSAANGEDVFDVARKSLTVRQSRLNNLIEILYSGNDPRLAANFVNALADEYQQQNLETRWQMSQNAGNWFARHLVDFRKQLEASENELQNYSRAQGLLIVSDSDKDSVAKERLSQLQEALSRAQSERMTRQAQMEMGANSTPDSVPQVLDNTELKEYQVKISDLQRQLAEYKQLYTPTNPK